MFWVKHHPQDDKFRAKPDQSQQSSILQAYKWFKRYIVGNLKVLNGYSYQVFSQTAT